MKKPDGKAFQALWDLGELIQRIHFRNRYIPSPESLSTLNRIFRFVDKHFTTTIAKNSVFFRARVNKERGQLGRFYRKKEMGAPPWHLAEPGRINPEGIPVLYCSKEEATAVAEVRPWISAKVSVSAVILKKSIRVADFTFVASFPKKAEYANIFASAMLLNTKFGLPSDPSDKKVYFSTQYISEYLKEKGFDGIMYNSSLNPKGINLAIFDSKIGLIERPKVFRIQSIKYDYKNEKQYQKFKRDMKKKFEEEKRSRD